ncbi:MAG: EAL domain-containing protein [Actinomycetota bacterium]|nr:EAL domain-containing protein [Actinomycetota bacterium]
MYARSSPQFSEATFRSFEEAESFAAHLLSCVPGAGAFVFDSDLTIVFAGGCVLPSVGDTADMAVGRSLADVLSTLGWERLAPIYDRVLAGESFDVECEATDGRAYIKHGRPIVGAAGKVHGGVLVAREAVTRAEERLAQQLRQQSAVADLGRLALSGEATFPELIAEARRLVVEALHEAGTCGVVELLPDRERYVVHTEELRGQMFPVSGSLIEHALRRGEPVVFPDSSVDAFPPRLAPFGFRSALMAVIGATSAPFGGLGAFSTSPHAFSQDDLVFLQAIANVLAEAARREQTDQALRAHALQDPVTGLASSPLLDDRLRQSLRFAKRAGLRVGVLIVDLDRFQLFNDALGHQAGDDILRAVGARLTSAVRSSDTVARIGGDKFVIVANALEGEADAARIADTVLGLVRAPIRVAGRELHTRASIGITISDRDTDPEDPDALIRSADAAMYSSKSHGRNRWEVYDTAQTRTRVDALQIEDALRRALVNGELRLSFQPFLRLENRSAFGVEVLVRWEHPTEGLVGPAYFLDIAEQSGLIVAIGEWMLAEACKQAAQWVSDVPLLLTINLSATQLGDPRIVNVVQSALAESRLPPECLGLELTEQVLIADEPAVHRTLTALKGLGVKLLLDDFGTGYSSLSHLKAFPFDTVKIDRSFIAGLREGEETGDYAIVAAIVGMSWATDKQVIAEGVETQLQADLLRTMGCELGQGYLFAKPMPADELEVWLRQVRTRRLLG